jgi:exopolysaccharide production protein ExoY
MSTASVEKPVAPPVTGFHKPYSTRPQTAFNARTHGGMSRNARSRAPHAETFAVPASAHEARLESSIRPICIWKRSLDVVLVLITLPITLPLMAMVAAWIRLASRGPAIFRQERIGYKGRHYTLYKFRSMHLNADTSRHNRHFSDLVHSGSPMVKLDLLEDKRLIPLGCLLRSAGLDELPQLFNVLRGEMSLVGPRPCLPEEYQFYSSNQKIRFQVLPGLTGIWQVEGKNLSTFDQMNDMDAHYVRHASPLFDLSIMLHTPFALLRQMRLACKNHRATAAANKPEPARFDAKPMAGCITQRLR